MTILTITEHPGGYAARTRRNAEYADITVAFALNFDTPGEKLTRSAAGDRYVGIEFEPYRMLGDAFTPAEMILAKIAELGNGAGAGAGAGADANNVRIVNIAGNGIYTLVRQGLYQEDIDDYLFDVLAAVHGQHRIDEVVTGGQTGMDMAGAIAAVAVGVERVSVVMAEGYMQRLVDGKDVCSTAAEIRDQVDAEVRRLLE